ncbi:unnamed protein product [Penicillium olsonii]|uniref:N-acetyltransferase domain-containing protein n=1 Tax=Penicillium olsonii TaxID=99116 RepID=A0A9W4HHR8_PENOL|nr:unnamed protein product [Penicillium olsonii]
MAMRCPRKDLDTRSSVSKPEISTFPHSETDLNSGDDAGAVVFLFPPPGRKPWTIQRIWLACKLWVLDRLKPADDNGASEKVGHPGCTRTQPWKAILMIHVQRVDVLFDKHESSAELLQKIYARNKLWYLEVIAVHPSLQSRGLGGGVMRWILEHVHNEPIYLECTRKENVGFYERFGFEVVEEVELVDEQEVLRHWVMVRPGVL